MSCATIINDIPLLNIWSILWLCLGFCWLPPHVPLLIMLNSLGVMYREWWLPTNRGLRTAWFGKVKPTSTLWLHRRNTQKKIQADDNLMHKSIVEQLLTTQKEAKRASQTRNYTLCMYLCIYCKFLNLCYMCSVTYSFYLYEDNASTVGTSWCVNKWQINY